MMIRKKKREKKERKIEKNKPFFKKKKDGDAHIAKEWDSDEESSSNNEDVATLAFNKSSLLPNVDHTCLMSKESKKKVYPKSSPKYTSSSDELDDKSSDDEKLSMIFKGLDRK
jgi:hypothetical protein